MALSGRFDGATGLGGYAAGLSMLHFHILFWWAFITGSLASAITGLAIGILSLWIKGAYLATSTAAFQFISEYVFLQVG